MHYAIYKLYMDINKILPPRPLFINIPYFPFGSPLLHPLPFLIFLELHRRLPPLNGMGVVLQVRCVNVDFIPAFAWRARLPIAGLAIDRWLAFASLPVTSPRVVAVFWVISTCAFARQGQRCPRRRVALSRTFGIIIVVTRRDVTCSWYLGAICTFWSTEMTCKWKYCLKK